MGDFDNYPEGNFCKTQSNCSTTFILCSLERREKNLLNEIYFIFSSKFDYFSFMCYVKVTLPRLLLKLLFLGSAYCA